MYTINQDVLYHAMGVLIKRIEECGASTELTHAVSLASDLRMAIGNDFNNPDPFALVRVLEAIGVKP